MGQLGGSLGRRAGGDGGQERQGEHGECDVPVPRGPVADLVVIESDLALGGLKALLDAPTDTGDTAELPPDQPNGTALSTPPADPQPVARLLGNPDVPTIDKPSLRVARSQPRERGHGRSTTDCLLPGGLRSDSCFANAAISPKMATPTGVEVSRNGSSTDTKRTPWLRSSSSIFIASNAPCRVSRERANTTTASTCPDRTAVIISSNSGRSTLGSQPERPTSAEIPELSQPFAVMSASHFSR